jgi:hypothetical protein
VPSKRRVVRTSESHIGLVVATSSRLRSIPPRGLCSPIHQHLPRELGLTRRGYFLHTSIFPQKKMQFPQPWGMNGELRESTRSAGRTRSVGSNGVRLVAIETREPHPTLHLFGSSDGGGDRTANGDITRSQILSIFTSLTAYHCYTTAEMNLTLFQTLKSRPPDKRV